MFESLMVLGLPSIPADQLLGSLLAWRAVYYLLPLQAGGRGAVIRR